MGWFGKALGGIIGFAVGGPVGGLIGMSAGSSVDAYKDAKKEGKRQEGLINEQRERLAKEQSRLEKQRESSLNKLKRGQARASRARIRGGLFGDAGDSNRVSDVLGG